MLNRARVDCPKLEIHKKKWEIDQPLKHVKVVPYGDGILAALAPITVFQEWFPVG